MPVWVILLLIFLCSPILLLVWAFGMDMYESRALINPKRKKHIALCADRQRDYIAHSTHAIPVLFTANMREDMSVVQSNLISHLERRFPCGGIMMRLKDGSRRWIVFMEAHADTTKEYARSISKSMDLTWHIVGSDREVVETGLHKGLWTILAMSPSKYLFDITGRTFQRKSIRLDPSSDSGYSLHNVESNIRSESDDKPTNADTALSYVSVQERLDAVTAEFAAFEFNPIEYCFNRPLLHVLTETATARFYDAYPAACALLTTDADLREDKEYVREFDKAVSLAEMMWKLANENALNKAAASTNDETLSKARKMMDRALRESTPTPEAVVSWKKSLELLRAANLAPTPRAVAKMAQANPSVDRLVMELEAAPRQKELTS